METLFSKLLKDIIVEYIAQNSISLDENVSPDDVAQAVSMIAASFDLEVYVNRIIDDLKESLKTLTPTAALVLNTLISSLDLRRRENIMTDITEDELNTLIELVVKSNGNDETGKDISPDLVGKLKNSHLTFGDNDLHLILLRLSEDNILAMVIQRQLHAAFIRVSESKVYGSFIGFAGIREHLRKIMKGVASTKLPK